MRRKLDPAEQDARDSGIRQVRTANSSQDVARNGAEPDIGLSGTLARASDMRAVVLTAVQRERFHALYREHFDFVFRNLRRLGVPEPAVEDALQDVYLVVLRRIEEFQGTHVKAWLFAILLRVAGNYRRSQRRRGPSEPLLEEQLPASDAGPFEQAAREQARRILHGFLDSLEDNRRAVFVMAELEQMTAPEIARALSANLNTVYSWLRSARAEFVAWLAEGGAAHG
ncbi:MAG TPA: sigma-70 family RNA polymerase sigma factor [Polyangiales bacterium]|nr:sigma-70 family RNA polymerase sigma factor [Polyangiales bacterium]